MALIDPSRVYSKLLICFALPVLFLLYKRFALYRTRAKYSECKDPPRYPQKDFLLGLDVLREIITAVKSKCYLRCFKSDYCEDRSNSLEAGNTTAASDWWLIVKDWAMFDPLCSECRYLARNRR